MTPVLLLVLCIVVVACIIAGGVLFQYRVYRGTYKTLGRGVCDPGSWSVSFYLRTLLLRGRIGGHAIRYAVFGEHRGNQPVSSYLLLEFPVKRNFRFYAASDVNQADTGLRERLKELQENPGFCALIVTSRETPLLGRFLARPFGFGLRPGVLLWKWGKDAFDADVIRQDLALLIKLTDEGI